MQMGFLLDRAQNTQTVGTWVTGPAESGFFGVRTRGRQQWDVTTYRCESCGYLASFALERKK